MAAVPGRILCPRCGANNFETQAACWKCSALLAGGPPGASPVPPGAVPPASVAPTYARAAEGNRPTVDPAVAVWAGIALALFFPYIAIPVGIIFCMLDDRRKLDLGRITLIWGLISFILHTLITGWLLTSLMTQTLQQMYGIVRSRTGAAGGEENPASLPGLPTGTTPRSLPRIPEGPSYENLPFPEVPDSVKNR